MVHATLSSLVVRSKVISYRTYAWSSGSIHQEAMDYKHAKFWGRCWTFCNSMWVHSLSCQSQNFLGSCRRLRLVPGWPLLSFLAKLSRTPHCLWSPALLYLPVCCSELCLETVSHPLSAGLVTPLPHCCHCPRGMGQGAGGPGPSLGTVGGRTRCELRLQVPAHTSLSHYISPTKYKLKDKIIKHFKMELGGDMKPQVWSLSEEGDGGMRLHWSHAHEGGPVHIHSFNPLLQAWKALHWKPNITAGIWTWVVYFCS